MTGYGTRSNELEELRGRVMALESKLRQQVANPGGRLATDVDYLTVAQANTLTAKNIVRYSGGSWIKAQADDRAADGPLGFVLYRTSTSIAIALRGRVAVPDGAYSAGSVYYLDAATAGDVTTTAPTDPEELRRAVFYAVSATEIILFGPYITQLGAPTLDELQNVDAETPATGEVLVYNDSTKNWESGTIGSDGLPNVIAAGGPTGNGETVPVITYDAKGRLTAVTTAAITLGGDASGTPLAVSVNKIRGNTVQTGVPASDKMFLRWNSSTQQWAHYLLPNMTQGDLLAFDGTDFARIAIEASGKFLKSNGTQFGWDNLYALLTKYSTRTIITATGAYTHTFTAGKTRFAALILAGGGSGGQGIFSDSGTVGDDVDATISNLSRGNSGGAGECVLIAGDILATTATGTVGVGGTAPAGYGTNTTFVHDGTTITAAAGAPGDDNAPGIGGQSQMGTWDKFLVLRFAGQNGSRGGVDSIILRVDYSGTPDTRIRGFGAGTGTPGGLAAFTGASGQGNGGTGGTYSGGSVGNGGNGGNGMVVVFEA